MQELMDVATAFNKMTTEDKAALKRRLDEKEKLFLRATEYGGNIREYQGNRHERRRQAVMARK